MFKRRSSKDLSTKIGYGHVNANPTKKLDPSMPPASIAPVSHVSVPASGGTLKTQGPPSSTSSSSSRKTSATPSPDQRDSPSGLDGMASAAAGGAPGANIAGVSGESPLASLKDLPPSGSATKVAAGGGHALPASGGSAPALKGHSRSTSSSSRQQQQQQSSEPPSKSLVIGEGVLFEGTTEGCAAAVVGGRLKGIVKARRLEIARTGKMEGTGIAETAEIAGVFEGNLAVTKALKICSTGRFKGEVSFGSIIVENGGKLEGKVNFGSRRDPVPDSSKPPALPAPGQVSDKKKKTPVAAAPAPVMVVEKKKWMKPAPAQVAPTPVPISFVPAAKVSAPKFEVRPAQPMQSPE